MSMHCDLSNSRGQGGFSLVELMIVVALVGVLAVLAVPRFQSFQAKAKQTEAKNNLSHLYTLEQSYFGDNETFANVSACGGNGVACANVLGFQIRDSRRSVRYVYQVTGATATAFVGDAKAYEPVKILADCTNDEWTINESKVLANTADCTSH